MLRIVAGKYRSRMIEVPSEGTVPTKNRVREALFSSLGENVVGANVLDLFAGSGALGIESLSRGAAHCLFVDNAPEAVNVIQKNLASLGEKEGEVSLSDYRDALKGMGNPFDVVFLDPPYADTEAYRESLRLLEERKLLNPNALVYIEYEGDCPIDKTKYPAAKEKHYGRSHLLILRY